MCTNLEGLRGGIWREDARRLKGSGLLGYVASLPYSGLDAVVCGTETTLTRSMEHLQGLSAGLWEIREMDKPCQTVIA